MKRGSRKLPGSRKAFILRPDSSCGAGAGRLFSQAFWKMLLILAVGLAALSNSNAVSSNANAGLLVSSTRCVPLVPCCSELSRLGYERKWTSLCAYNTQSVAYCPMGTPYGSVGWDPLDGWCGIDPKTQAVCPACECCCPGVPITQTGSCTASARIRSLPELQEGVVCSGGRC